MKQSKLIEQLDMLKESVRTNPSTVASIGPRIRNIVSELRLRPGGLITPGGPAGAVNCAGHCFSHCVSHPKDDLILAGSDPV